MGLIVAVVVVLVLAAAGFWLVRYSPWSDPVSSRFSRSGRDRQKLQHKYGREYDRLLASHGDDHAAVEQEIARREREHGELEIKPLDPDDRARLVAAWTSAQAGFVEDPGASARSAEQLIGDALSTLGYPVGDPEQQLALASVDHAHSLAEFRDGHELLVRSHSGAPDVDTTEQLRQAMLHFRIFFEELTDSGSGARNKNQEALV